MTQLPLRIRPFCSHRCLRLRAVPSGAPHVLEQVEGNRLSPTAASGTALSWSHANRTGLGDRVDGDIRSSRIAPQSDVALRN